MDPVDGRGAARARVVGGRFRPYAWKRRHVRRSPGFDQLLRRFKTGIDKAGILREYKRKQRFKSAGELRREKAKAAALTAESTSMVFFKETDLARLFRHTAALLDEVTEVLFPECP